MAGGGNTEKNKILIIPLISAEGRIDAYYQSLWELIIYIIKPLCDGFNTPSLL